MTPLLRKKSELCPLLSPGLLFSSLMRSSGKPPIGGYSSLPLDRQMIMRSFDGVCPKAGKIFVQKNVSWTMRPSIMRRLNALFSVLDAQ